MNKDWVVCCELVNSIDSEQVKYIKHGDRLSEYNKHGQFVSLVVKHPSNRQTVLQGQISLDNLKGCHTEIKAGDVMCCFTQSQYIDMPTSSSSNHIM